MRLTTMMRLVVEEVLQNIRDPLLLRLTTGCRIGVRATEVAVAVAFDHRNDALVLPRTGARQLGPIIMDDGIKPISNIAFTREPTKPKPIGDQQVIERAVKAVKENANRTPIKLFGQGESCGVKPRICPSVISGELPENRFRHICLHGCM